MAASASKTIELKLPSELGNERLAIALAEAVATRMGFTSDRVDDLKTAVAEACVNAIEHGNRQDENVKVLVLLTVEPTRLAVDVVDQGEEPIPADRPVPSIEQMVDGKTPSGGFGMFLIRSLMDEVEISREPDGGNQLRMVIHLERECSSGRGGNARWATR